MSLCTRTDFLQNEFSKEHGERFYMSMELIEKC